MCNPNRRNSATLPKLFNITRQQISLSNCQNVKFSLLLYFTVPIQSSVDDLGTEFCMKNIFLQLMNIVILLQSNSKLQKMELPTARAIQPGVAGLKITD